MKRIKESAASNAWISYAHHQQADMNNPALLHTSLDSESEELLNLVREGHSPKDAIEIIVRSRPELKSLQEDSLKDEEQGDDATKDDKDNKEQDTDDQVPDSSDSGKADGGDSDNSSGNSEQGSADQSPGGSEPSVSEPEDDNSNSSQSDFKTRLLAVGEPESEEPEHEAVEDGESDDEDSESGEDEKPETDEPSDASSDTDSSGDAGSEPEDEENDDDSEDRDDDEDDSDSDDGDGEDDEDDSDDDDEDDGDDEEGSDSDEGEESEQSTHEDDVRLVSIGDPEGFQDKDEDGLQDIAPPPRDDLTDLGRNSALEQEEETILTDVQYEGESPTVPGSVAWRIPLHNGFRDNYSLALYVTPMTPQENETEDEMYLVHSRVESGMTPVFLDNPRADEDLQEEYRELAEKIPSAFQPMALLKASDTLTGKAKRVSLEDLKEFIKSNLDTELSKVARTNLRSIASLTYSSPDVPQAPPTPTSPLEESWKLSTVSLAPQLANKQDFDNLEDDYQFHTNEEEFEVVTYGDNLDHTGYLDDPCKIDTAKQGLICPKNPIPGYYKADHNVNLQCRNSARHLLVRGGEFLLLSSDPRSDEVIVTVDHREYFRVLPSDLEGMYKVDR